MPTKLVCFLSLLTLTLSCSSDDATGDDSDNLMTTPSTTEQTGTMPSSNPSTPASPMSPASTPPTPPVGAPGSGTMTPPSIPPQPPAPSSTGGAPGAGGAGLGGETTTAGTGGGGSGAGASSSGDAGSGGDASAPGGAGGMDSAGGMSSGGDAGEGAGGDGSEPSGMTNPSPGCGKGGRPDGGRVYNAGVSWLIFPESYDGDTPFKVLWAWHGCGAENFGDANRTEYWDRTRGTAFEDEYVVAVPLAASGNCFDYDTDIVRTKALYDELIENYCVDLDHMFGTGHSSGANFLHRMLQSSHAADWEYLGLRGIAPVASGPVNDHTTQVPVMYIHSPGESVDPNGPAGNFRDANGCMMSSQPYETAGCNSRHDGDPVNSNCISYEGCDVETIFCPHDDSDYGGTFHGIPCFWYDESHKWFMTL